MHENQDYSTTGGHNKILKKPIGFFSSYESKQENNKKSKPSKIAQLNFIKKIRNMRKKLRYLTQAEQSQQQLILLHKKYCSSVSSQTPSSQQYLKRKAPFNNQNQIFRKLLKVQEDKNQNQLNQENENSSSQIKSITKYFQQQKQNLNQQPQDQQQ